MPGSKKYCRRMYVKTQCHFPPSPPHPDHNKNQNHCNRFPSKARDGVRGQNVVIKMQEGGVSYLSVTLGTNEEEAALRYLTNIPFPGNIHYAYNFYMEGYPNLHVILQ